MLNRRFLNGTRGECTIQFSADLLNAGFHVTRFISSAFTVQSRIGVLEWFSKFWVNHFQVLHLVWYGNAGGETRDGEEWDFPDQDVVVVWEKLLVKSKVVLSCCKVFDTLVLDSVCLIRCRLHHHNHGNGIRLFISANISRRWSFSGVCVGGRGEGCSS